MPDEREFEAAIERLLDPERFSEAERVVAQAAPQLQKVLASAMAAGGWFGEPHEAEALRAATVPDPDERIAAVRALLAEEARMGMMVGVAVGWALKEEMTDPRRGRRIEGRALTMEIKFHGQSCFELSEGEATLLIDPFLKPNNPVAVATAEEVEPTHIALSHGHADHMADAVPSRQAHRCPLHRDGRAGELARRAGRGERQRSQLRRHRQLRVGLDQARARLAHEHDPRLRRGPLQRRARNRDGAGRRV